VADPIAPLTTAEALALVPWLAESSPAARASLLAQASLRRVDKHEAVFHRGDAIEHLWVVVSGQIEVSVVGADGRRFVAAQVPPGEAVGFIPLLDGQGAIHDARAVQPSTLLRLPRGAFLAALQADVQLLQTVLRLILARGRRLNEWRAEITMRPLAPRLARLLVGLARSMGVPGADPGTVELAISQDDLAAMVGVTRQALNPEIKAMERAGLLELAYKRVAIRNVDGLQSVVDQTSV
jgi:CRP/FNR family transcriptional regulator, cyclic AMP receptor protein